jgi:hypothetical protein
MKEALVESLSVPLDGVGVLPAGSTAVSAS